MKIESIFFHIHKPDILPVGIKYEQYKDIDNYEENSIPNITIQDLLDYVDSQHTIPTLELMYNKLQTEGTLTIQGTDLKQLASSVIFKEIDYDICQKILYSHNKKSIHIMSEIVKILKAIGFSIQIMRYVNIFEYYIVAQKNDKN